MNPLFHSVLLLFLLAAHSWAAQLADLDAELKKPWPGNRTVNIVFHGHSVPAGYHTTPEVKPIESYPHLFRVLLKERYPNAVINVITTAIGGENSIAGAARFATDVLPQQPDLVFIDYALNDRAITLAQADAAWRSMIAMTKSHGIPVVLITPTGASNADLSNPTDSLTQRANLIRSLAQSENVLLGEVSGAWLAALASGTPQSQFLSQGNHPNLAGHLVAADAIYSAFMAATGAIATGVVNSFMAKPTISPSAGSRITLTWEVENVSTLTLDPGDIDVFALTTNGVGSVQVYPMMTTTYTLTAEDTVTSQVTVHIPLRINGIFFDAPNPVEVTVSGLREGVEYGLFRSPDLRAPFLPVGSPVTGDSTGLRIFLDPATNLQASPNAYYQVGTIPQ